MKGKYPTRCAVAQASCLLSYLLGLVLTQAPLLAPFLLSACFFVPNVGSGDIFFSISLFRVQKLRPITELEVVFREPQRTRIECGSPFSFLQQPLEVPSLGPKPQLWACSDGENNGVLPLAQLF